MNKKIFYCTKENNDCPNKERCERYQYADEKDIGITTLYKVACTEENGRRLFMKVKEEQDAGDSNDGAENQ